MKEENGTVEKEENGTVEKEERDKREVRYE